MKFQKEEFVMKSPKPSMDVSPVILKDLDNKQKKLKFFSQNIPTDNVQKMHNLGLQNIFGV